MSQYVKAMIQFCEEFKAKHGVDATLVNLGCPLCRLEFNQSIPPVSLFCDPTCDRHGGEVGIDGAKRRQIVKEIREQLGAKNSLG